MRAEQTACSPYPASVRGEPERRPARAHATAAQPVPRYTVLALRALLAARARVRPAPPKCACVRWARCGRPAESDVSASPCQYALQARRALRAHPQPPSVCGARGSRFEGGTHTSAYVSAHPSSALHDIRGALRGRHSSVSAPPRRGVRGALYALRAARARDRPPPPRHAGSVLCSLSATRTRVSSPRPRAGVRG